MSSNSQNQLRLNVGFLLNAPVGESREFPFEINQTQLDPELEVHDLSGQAKITRTAQGLLAQVQMQASLDAECVRCLVDFRQPLEIDFTELYAFSKSAVTESNLVMPENAHIDLTPLAREYMLLAVPMNALCRPDCKGLCPICGENLNEKDHNHEGETIDPRLEALKSLLDDEEEKKI